MNNITALQLETHLNEAQREKDDIESRLEEESEEIEQLTNKLRTSITQNGNLQQQINEYNYQIDELESSKQTLESKVRNWYWLMNE